MIFKFDLLLLQLMRQLFNTKSFANFKQKIY